MRIGNATVDDYCDSVLDTPCEAQNLSCGSLNYFDSDTNTLVRVSKCRAPSDGGWRSTCGAIMDPSCISGVCDQDQLGNSYCQNVGGGTQGDRCGRLNDVPCIAPLMCAPSSQGNYLTCRAPGNGTAGSACGVGADLPCAAASNCTALADSLNGYAECRVPGNGTLDSNCGTQSDQICRIGLVCDYKAGTCRCAR